MLGYLYQSIKDCTYVQSSMEQTRISYKIWEEVLDWEILRRLILEVKELENLAKNASLITWQNLKTSLCLLRVEAIWNIKGHSAWRPS